jgi:hypothetical protein
MVFHQKKQKRLEATDDPAEAGDGWDIHGMDPLSKLLITLVPGQRTAEKIHQAVADAAGRLAEDWPLPAIFTDGEPAYQEAIWHAFGREYPGTRTSHLGRPPQPIVPVPQTLLDAQVIKRRQAGQVVEVEIRPVFGTGKLAATVEKLGGIKPNTSAIERDNLTDRMRNRRKQRKTLGFSKESRFHDWMSWISTLWYNFHFTHRSLTIKTQDGACLHRTPAMAAGITNHVYSTLQLMRLVVL